MELGNLIFGNSRGEVQVPREDEWERPVGELMDVLPGSFGGMFGRGYGIDYECPLFEMHPYWWGDDDAPEAPRPNFLYKPTGFELRWYKYALRDSYMTPGVTLAKWRQMFAECMAYVKGGQHGATL